MIFGLDVSAYQGKSIDWSKVAAAGNRFAIIKVSEGDKSLDPTRQINLTNAKAAGLYTGVYHFAHPAVGDGATQAQKLWDACGGVMPDLPPALDLESTGSLGSEAALTFTRDFIVACESLFGKKPLLYTGSWFWKALGSDGSKAADVAECPLWTAEYAHGATWSPAATDHPSMYAPWSTWTIWQFASPAPMPGVVGGVDRNVFNGSEGDLRALCGFTPAPPSAA